MVRDASAGDGLIVVSRKVGDGFETLGAFAAQGLDASEMYKVERAGEGLKFDPDRPVRTAGTADALAALGGEVE